MNEASVAIAKGKMVQQDRVHAVIYDDGSSCFPQKGLERAHLWHVTAKGLYH